MDRDPVSRSSTASEDVDDFALVEAETRPKRRKKDLPRVHELVEAYDATGLRAHLEAHPEDIDLKNDDGDAPLHVVADKGAVILAEVLDDLGVDHLATDRTGLYAAHRAAERHPRTASFLFDRAKAARVPEASVMTGADIAARIEKHGIDAPDDIDALAAELCGIDVDDLNAARQVIKNRTHFEAVKGTILELKSEGWWQADFGPQRVRSLLSAIAEIDREGAPSPDARTLLETEISTQLDLIRSIRRVRAMSKCTAPAIRRTAMALEASLVAPRILGASSDDGEVTLALGWKGHAIYAGFSKVAADPKNGHPEPTLLVRIDNRGGGSSIAHDKDDDGAVVCRSFHIPAAFLDEKGKRAFTDFVADLLIVKATPDSKADDFYTHVADFKHRLKNDTEAKSSLIESAYGVPPETALPPQIAGNCVVANTHPGLCARLGPELEPWFSTFERDLARRLVDEFADPNALIDDQCRERDEREIGKLLDLDGPWGAKLEEILDAAKYPNADRVAAKTTAEQLAKVIEAGDSQALRLLLAHGAPLEVQGDRDRTPLHIAARAGDEACVAALLEAGANVHAMDEDGNTPLHIAVTASSSSCVAALLAKGADRDRENKAGVTPRQMIARQVDQTLLIAETLDANAQGDDGKVTPLRRRRRPFAPTGT